MTTQLNVRLKMTLHWTLSYNTVPTPTVMVIEGNTTIVYVYYCTVSVDITSHCLCASALHAVVRTISLPFILHYITDSRISNCTSTDINMDAGLSCLLRKIFVPVGINLHRANQSAQTQSLGRPTRKYKSCASVCYPVRTNPGRWYTNQSAQILSPGVPTSQRISPFPRCANQSVPTVFSLPMYLPVQHKVCTLLFHQSAQALP
jgi:hypothetical protein